MGDPLKLMKAARNCTHSAKQTARAEGRTNDPLRMCFCLMTDRLVIYENRPVLSSDNSGCERPPQPSPSPAQAPATIAASPSAANAADAVAAPVTHYENFPVASVLCPPHLRQPIAAIYGFARTADDIADEGDAPAADRLADLAAFHADLMAIAQGQPPSPRWASVFLPLQAVLRSHQLPVPLLADLLSAFAQDVEKTRDAEGYADRAELLDYCRRSANPVGRLLLHLYGVHGDEALRESDAICTALQLINFWQDLSVDIPGAATTCRAPTA